MSDEEFPSPRYVDRGDYWEDMEKKMTLTYDKDGNVTGGYCCPYIPKDLKPKKVES